MGTLVGHVAPGAGFLLIGLWHLFNHIKLHHQHPSSSYTSPPWFPTSRIKYLELILIMLGSSISIAMELFIGPEKHQPFDVDGTIPSNHLHNFEHSSISMAFLVYAAFSILLDRSSRSASASASGKYALTQLLAAAAFGQQLLMFRLHSTDHVGVEGQYHSLLQIVIAVTLATTLMGIGLPRSFPVSLVRSASITFQGAWLVLMGYMLWTPGLIPKGCNLHWEEGHQVVSCSPMEALHRAKSLVNIEFSWLLVAFMIFTVSLYLLLGSVYGGKGEQEYWSLGMPPNGNGNGNGKEEEEEEDDLESQQGMIVNGNKKSSNLEFVHMGNLYPMDIER